MLEGKKILLGVCGSIASYKSASLVRLLVKAGANVKVIMTADATNFITPLTLSTLSKNPVSLAYFDKANGVWDSHVDLGLWADLFLIAPASANTLAKMAQGLCDNLLTAVYLSARCPVYFAPAMDLDMWKHPATRRNIKTLLSNGNREIRPGSGELASGLSGEGRMAEPEDIIRLIRDSISRTLELSGKRVLITAGPTYEAIDPVRFIGNYSTGKMGYALAEEFAARGAIVTLVSGPSALSVSHAQIERLMVRSSDEMAARVQERFPESDIAVMSAAVADYKPAEVARQKIKKAEASLSLELTKTTDILAMAGKNKREGQLLIGFALETENEQENAIKKLKKKNLDFIVLNSLNDDGAGFQTDTNKISIIDASLRVEHFPLKSKQEVACDICNKITSLL